MGFRQVLAMSQEKKQSLVCAGLDPSKNKIPYIVNGMMRTRPYWERVAKYMIGVVDATAGIVSAFKPQRAHYEAFRLGELALRRIVSHIHDYHPGTPVFLDCKRGDIGSTQGKYRIAHLELDGVDGMNFSPYMGEDTISALYDKKTRYAALVGLCFTSNPKARDIQNVELKNGLLLYEHVAMKILEWAQELGCVEDAGLVVAAAYKDSETGKIEYGHMERIRAIVGDKLWFLEPGIGAQGGLVEQTVDHSYRGKGSILINSSRGIIEASQDEDYAEAAAAKAEELRDRIRAVTGTIN